VTATACSSKRSSAPDASATTNSRPPRLTLQTVARQSTSRMPVDLFATAIRKSVTHATPGESARSAETPTSQDRRRMPSRRNAISAECGISAAQMPEACKPATSSGSRIESATVLEHRMTPQQQQGEVSAATQKGPVGAEQIIGSLKFRPYVAICQMADGTKSSEPTPLRPKPKASLSKVWIKAIYIE
jgi:hypothetical protein